jgi:hypothetical protein
LSSSALLAGSHMVFQRCWLVWQKASYAGRFGQWLAYPMDSRDNVKRMLWLVLRVVVSRAVEASFIHP